ncbi:MAG: methylthioribulose 1-phosphate dehydratase [Actinomycetota bacterium]|nr:methylthioribulose 1-phosphate dehydratase [Actinomycetota bacterium]
MVESTTAKDRPHAVASWEANGGQSLGFDVLQRLERAYECFERIGREFHSRGWVLGTSGNFSAIVSRTPLRLAITVTGVDKGSLSPADVVLVDGQGTTVAGSGAPSGEMQLHRAILGATYAGAVLHTHSVWATVLSDRVGAGGAVEFAGQEMLKGLSGVSTHLHRERLPVIENSQDMDVLCAGAEEELARHPSAHGMLICRHGLYAWGADVAAAKRTVESLEFLLEVSGRTDRPGATGGRGEELTPWLC